MMKIVAQAPTRVDLAGGTLDLWPIHCILDKCATLNVAVSLPAEVEIEEASEFKLVSNDQKISTSGSYNEIIRSEELPLLGLALAAVWNEVLPPVKLTTSAKSPAGAGLGGSSCLLVTILGALTKYRQCFEPEFVLPEAKLVMTAQNIEAKLIHAPTGCQDYWGAVRGGINVISYPISGVEVKTYPTSQMPELNEHLLLCYSGQSRASAINNWEIFKRTFDRDQKLIDQLQALGNLSAACVESVNNKDFDGLMKLSQEEWKGRLQLWPNIETEQTRRLDHAAKKAGAVFTRVCGAGGGGVMAVLCAPDKHKQVSQAVEGLGGKIIGSGIESSGLKVW